MKTNILFKALGLVVAAFLLVECSTVPLSGRRQVNLLPESELVAMGLTNYNEFISANTISSNISSASMIRVVGTDLTTSLTEYLTQNNLLDRINGYQWEFSLVADNTPNAWCMPGGKIVVYEGILPYTLDKNGMAVVMAHEIAHAVARHGNERMSHQLIIQFGGVALSEITKEKPEETRNIFMSVYGIGSQLGAVLPYSREHEKEADRLGLIIMAMAGYNPEAAVAFWERMDTAGGTAPPEFLSTHPSNSTRIREIKSFLPEAMKYYRTQ